ncbi:hypothetical protein CAOG_00548 [Capsaspora owczarzaki ATCC 30864]|uniref:Amino acid permease n=1 Tax=Capsaspora owczarzaki (strain ATCC 30864) TaxID=595528 RepID=A0A0D2X0F8_CAPO3|nr:hypothetical protein CAOG_00548 [Capsaspora owczarzaki ATCC 30864]KJE88984.1 hypothetical protein CAOG_000548 [Capsaspora owczarzaki ATCC 30864]|eukprot:XP_004365419.2 hypothetical protein CAOG_00548 [Capsaspora owczarzaki ATCC 30864]
MSEFDALHDRAVSPTDSFTGSVNVGPTGALSPGGRPQRVGSSASLLLLGHTAVDTAHMPEDVQDWEWPGSGVAERINDLTYTFAQSPVPTRTSVSHHGADNSTNINSDDEDAGLMGRGKPAPSGDGGAGDEKANDVTIPLLGGAVQSAHKKLGQLAATAIAGNDITGSCLYTLGICTYYAGIWAPLSLFLVVIMLYFFRSIYGEVVTALPVNGGTYSVLLNTSTKLLAALAACLTILSYISTAVVSAASSMEYFIGLYSDTNVKVGTICVLGIFCLLTLMGIKESAPVAVTIFILHLLTLTILIVACFVDACQDGFKRLSHNWEIRADPDFPYPDVGNAIFYGFCAAMLGITGFETSANYVEEQAPGVFVKTLRNMWIAVGLLNPTLSFLSLCTLDLKDAVLGSTNGTSTSGGNNALLLAMVPSSYTWLQKLVSADAALVLMGGVFTSYVGITGLVRRLSLDRCLPSVLAKTNRFTHSNHYIIIGFFLLCTSLYLILDGNLLDLSGIYTLSFLVVMGLFAVGNLLLKYSRSKLQRKVHANKLGVLLALSAVGAALVGNILLNVENVKWFFLYYSVAVMSVIIMLRRTFVLKLLLRFLRNIKHHPLIFFWRPTQWALDACISAMRSIKSQKMVFFAKTEDITVMNKAAMYVRDNEHTMWLQIVHVHARGVPVPAGLEENVRTLDRIYPKMRIDFIAVQHDTFDGEAIDLISQRLEFAQDMGQLGNVRLITH